MKKILVVALGGTIGSVWSDKITPDKNPLKVLDALPICPIFRIKII